MKIKCFLLFIFFSALPLNSAWLKLDGMKNYYTINMCLDSVGNIYACTFEHGAWKSTDKGSNWRQMSVDIVSPNRPEYIIAAADSTLYMKHGLNVLYSTDFGDSWQNLTPWETTNGWGFVYAPDNNIYVYQINSGKGAYQKTINQGKKWESVSPSGYKNGGIDYNINILSAKSNGNMYGLAYSPSSMIYRIVELNRSNNSWHYQLSFPDRNQGSEIIFRFMSNPNDDNYLLWACKRKFDADKKEYDYIEQWIKDKNGNYYHSGYMLPPPDSVLINTFCYNREGRIILTTGTGEGEYYILCDTIRPGAVWHKLPIEPHPASSMFIDKDGFLYIGELNGVFKYDVPIDIIISVNEQNKKDEFISWSVQIFNILGQSISERQYYCSRKELSERITQEQLPEGLYIWRAVSGNIIIYDKLLR
ncbi:MAG: hypothetical protein QG635_1041 [Bacteroidota bacterium]|nr:hypothetical protein [Bacteroidota bacterium]